MAINGFHSDSWAVSICTSHIEQMYLHTFVALKEVESSSIEPSSHAVLNVI